MQQHAQRIQALAQHAAFEQAAGYLDVRNTKLIYTRRAKLHRSFGARYAARCGIGEGAQAGGHPTSAIVGADEVTPGETVTETRPLAGLQGPGFTGFAVCIELASTS